MRPIRLAVDVASGDPGIKVLIDGVYQAKNASQFPFTVHLCGPELSIRKVLADKGCSNPASDDLIIENCPETVGEADIPSRVWRTRKFSPIIRCISLQKEGAVDASLSAGDTRILMGAALFILGRLKNVSRPALAAFMPTTTGHPMLLLDVGANLECRKEHLVAFGRMGSEYYSRFSGIECPKVALLNIGLEPTKGTKTIVSAQEELSKIVKGYCGFVEGGGLLAGDVDVAVCDGFAGNVLLKTCERFYSLAESVLGENGIMPEKIKKNLAVLNPDNYGGVPLLGIRGIVFKAHGSSSSRAFAHAITASVNAVHRGLIGTDPERVANFS